MFYTISMPQSKRRGRGKGRVKGPIARRAIPELPGILAGLTKAALLLVSLHIYEL